MFITIEGIDGSGKSTQIELLSKYFIENQMDFIVLREPGGTKLGEKIREILLDKKNNISKVSELLLFEASRAELIEKIIFPNIKLGKIVLCDRFIDSTLAYQGFARGLDLKFIENIHNYFKILPDLTIYLDIDVELAYNRLDKNLDRLEKEGKIFQEKVKKGYLFLAEKYKNRIKIVNANSLSKIEIHEKIIKLIKNFIFQYKTF